MHSQHPFVQYKEEEPRRAPVEVLVVPHSGAAVSSSAAFPSPSPSPSPSSSSSALVVDIVPSPSPAPFEPLLIDNDRDENDRSPADRDSDEEAAAAAVAVAAAADAAEAAKRRQRPQQKEPEHTPICMIAAVSICATMFCWEMYLNDWTFEDYRMNPFFGPSTAVMIQAGAKDTSKIVDGEWWRLVSMQFLHSGCIHLLFNLIAIYRIGFPLEAEFGPWRVGPLYFISGVFGAVVSCLFLPREITVGASGAIFGLLGADWAYLIQNWSLVPNKCSYTLSLTFGTCFNLGLGLMPYLDNFCHVGGFVAGVLLGTVLLIEKIRNRDSATFCQKFRASIAAVAMVVLFAAGAILLYERVDPMQWCSWCHYINCVETPLWTCDTGAVCEGYSYPNGTVVLTCPNGKVFWEDYATFDQQLCDDVCG